MLLLHPGLLQKAIYRLHGASRDFFTLIRRHQAAFDYFGGVTQQRLYDGEKIVLLR